MIEAELRNILNSLSHLATHGDIPVQAFATLMRTASPEILAEHLHQRWLADQHFGNVAARILAFSHNNERRDMRLCSAVLQLVLDDYKSRDELRHADRRTFRNYCRTLIELLPVYLNMDDFMGLSLVAPFFDSAHLLIDDAQEDEDLQCMGQILMRAGSLLNELNSSECDKLVMKTRHALCFHDHNLKSYTRFTLLNAIELWTYQWRVAQMPVELFEFYAQQYERFRLLAYEERRWLPSEISRQLDSERSLTQSTTPSRALTPDEPSSPSHNEGPESVV